MAAIWRAEGLDHAAMVADREASLDRARAADLEQAAMSDATLHQGWISTDAAIAHLRGGARRHKALGDAWQATGWFREADDAYRNAASAAQRADELKAREG